MLSISVSVCVCLCLSVSVSVSVSVSGSVSVSPCEVNALEQRALLCERQKRFLGNQFTVVQINTLKQMATKARVRREDEIEETGRE